MKHRSIFYDESRRRWRRLKRAGIVLGIIGIVLGTLFLLSLLVMPVVRPVPGLIEPVRSRAKQPGPRRTQREKKLRHYVLNQIDAEFRAGLENRLPVDRKAEKKDHVVAAFYAIWQESGLHSLRAHADQMTHLMPEWLHLSPDGTGIDLYDWNPDLVYHNHEVMQIARQSKLVVMPVFNNAAGTKFDRNRVHLLLTDPARQSTVAKKLKEFLVANKFGGVNIDFENISLADAPHYAEFLHLLHSVLKPAGLQLSVDLEANSDYLDWGKIAAACDFVILMGYDEHFGGSVAGPIASIRWYTNLLSRGLASIPGDKLVVGVANYAYDWKNGLPPAKHMTFQQALLTARDYRPDEKPSDIVDFDPDAINPTYNYRDEFNKLHEVWFLDGVTAANQWKLAQRSGVRGGAVWLLGSEDPSIWGFIGEDAMHRPVDATRLSTITFPYYVEFMGQGDILRVDSMPQKGIRTIESDSATGLFTDESYQTFPTAFVIRRNGLVPKTVALTFDDGPYEPYTSEILDDLKAFNIKATFFVIGENIERHPDLVERMWHEGHEIGNHSYTHPNIGMVTEQRARLELNATTRAIQSVIGRSTIFFRPPYNADAEPTSEEEVWPVVFASKLGYITVGEFIDPQDWNIDIRIPGQGVYHRTARDIADAILQKVRTGHGNAILLHDGGGDRERTVEAVRLVIPALLKEGYRFVKVSELLGVSTDTAMPKVENSDRLLLGADRLVFEINFIIETVLRFAFISAIILGTLRLFFITTLALIARFRERRRTFDTTYRPVVSVIIATFNEEKVIARTIDAVLASRYEKLEIIVVDDGSKDNTSIVVSQLYGDNPAVRLVHQENSGKAMALNNGMTFASGEILVCLDADTIFAADTIPKLVRRFADPSVGGVAGNVKVGNRVNILTYWQAIEYITSQNLDRRAYAMFNAVTVIPGAVGAWRTRAVIEAGGYLHDTLAEDMDLTWRIRKAGWRIENEPEAYGYTEAPDTIRALFKQRFRWTYGTLQCLWKHRKMLGRYGAFGRVMLPTLWLFQIIYQSISPLIDLQIVWALVSVGRTWMSRSVYNQDWQPLVLALESLSFIGAIYLFFFCIELVGAYIAFDMERERKGHLWWLFWQRFVYRQLMYAVVLRALKNAAKGMHIGWGKLERKGTVEARH